MRARLVPRPPLALILSFLAVSGLLLLEDLFARPFTFLTGISFEAVRRAEMALLLGIAALLTARFVRRDLIHGLLERRAGKALPHLIGDVASLFVFVVGAAIIMTGVYGWDIGAVVAAGGLSLAIIGLALKDVILAVFNGAALNVENAFMVGDRVRIGEVDGTVVQSTWRSTTILTKARRLVTIPNIALGTASITNFDRPDKSEQRVIEICLDYDVTADSAERILLAGVLGAAGITLVDAPRVHAIRLDRDGVIYAIRYVIANHDLGLSSDHAVIKSILAHLRDAGIGVSYPKQEVVNAERRIRVADRTVDRRVLVQQCGLFRGLPPEVQARIADALIEQKVQAGASIIAAGTVRSSLFIVGEGLIKRLRARPDRPGFVEERYVATQVFGRRAFLSGLPHPARIGAVTQSLVFELSRTAFAGILAAHPEIRVPLATNLARSPTLDLTHATEVSALEARAERPAAFYLGLLESIASTDANAR
ncbi:mechanosensitive ion channel family protein [uncultured Methylobacterium sp.]|uniref:mechanosensitive ion channel family protein n=1 Tax=uncultured Methylobacterium sp. TaxID=157278 RepID=UPI0035CB9292